MNIGEHGPPNHITWYEVAGIVNHTCSLRGLRTSSHLREYDSDVGGLTVVSIGEAWGEWRGKREAKR